MTTATKTPPSVAPSKEEITAALWQLSIAMRTDIEVSRQIDQRQPVYVLHDPVSFRSHRLHARQYDVLTGLSRDETLQAYFERLAARGVFDYDEDRVFLEMILAFSRLGLVAIPMASGSQLFDQHQRVSSFKRRNKIMSLLFLQIPLTNPNEFLSRTQHLVAWMFTKTFALCWMLGLMAALGVVVSRFSELAQPFNSLLATGNIPFLWSAFVLLKIWHELGHGYACRLMGGSVPEMGIFLFAGTPAAYVDATAAWSLPRRAQRLLVMAGGMYFESMVFIVGIFVWAFAQNPFVSSCAYQLVVMASLVTLLFNVNPLMQFDGYFILSELTGIQNLRSRARLHQKRMFMAHILRIPQDGPQPSFARRLLLNLYGCCAGLYRTTIIFSIAVTVAIRFPLVGLVLAAFHLITSIFGSIWVFGKWLLADDETAPARSRAQIVAATVFAGVPLLLFLLPMPLRVSVEGLVGATSETYMNAGHPGTLERIHAEPGQPVRAGQPLLTMSDVQLDKQHVQTVGQLQEAKLSRKVIQAEDPGEAARHTARIRELQEQLRDIEKRQTGLKFHAESDGRLASILQPKEAGRFVRIGEVVAVIVNDAPIVRAWLNEQQLGDIDASIDSELSFQLSGRPLESFTGRIASICPAADETFNELALTYQGGGDVVIDPQSNAPVTPLFRVEIEVTEGDLSLNEHGTRVYLKLQRSGESIGMWASRRCVRFLNQLLKT